MIANTEIQNVVAEWLHELTAPQVRALASQHKIAGAMTAPINTLLGALLDLPAVAVQAGVSEADAGVSDGKEVRQA